LDFVFSDGDGKYDNGGGKDYHSPVAAEDGSTTEIDHVAEREAALEAQYGAHDEAGAVRAGKRAERAFLAQQGFTQKAAANMAVAKVVTLPANPRAGRVGTPGCQMGYIGPYTGYHQLNRVLTAK
jgi:starch synthase